jgi:catechol 2,3-dioxygenase-like lactoylglutathione lyase family enzyme
MVKRVTRGASASLLGVLLVFSPASAPLTRPSVSAAAAEPGFRPFLVALLVEDLGASRRWYEEVLGFPGSDDGGLPATGDMSGVILERTGFRLELIARKGSFAASSRLTTGDEPLLRGIKKIAFVVDDLGVVAARASARGSTVVRGLHPSRYAGMRSMILADPDGNWIQIYDQRAAERRDQ